MLVIRRRAGESILLGESIEIQVTEIGPSRVKLGITAPPEVVILRKEIKLTREQNQAAAQGVAMDRAAELAAQVARARRSGGAHAGDRATPRPANPLA